MTDSSTKNAPPATAVEEEGGGATKNEEANEIMNEKEERGRRVDENVVAVVVGGRAADSARKTPEKNTPERPQKLSPVRELSTGDFNRLFVKRANGDSSCVRVQNRYGKGMGHTIVLDFECASNGIGWEEPERVYVQGFREREDGTKMFNTMSLCKMIATNRLVFGSSIASCPFEVDPEPYTKQGYLYWVDALKHCYRQACAAAKDVERAALQLCDQDMKPTAIASRAETA